MILNSRLAPCPRGIVALERIPVEPRTIQMPTTLHKHESHNQLFFWYVYQQSYCQLCATARRRCLTPPLLHLPPIAPHKSLATNPRLIMLFIVCLIAQRRNLVHERVRQRALAVRSVCGLPPTQRVPRGRGVMARMRLFFCAPGPRYKRGLAHAALYICLNYLVGACERAETSVASVLPSPPGFGPTPSSSMAGTPPASDSAQRASSDAELFSVDNMQLHTLPDKRVLCYRVYGAPGPSSAPPGAWAVYYHGTPSCCLEGAAFDDAARSLGISLICTDRPGIGGSTSHRRQSLASVVADTASLLDAMGVAKVYLVGTSGGAPYAAAFAAQHPERSLGMALTAALAPTDRRHKELLKAMAGADRFMFTMARYPVGGLRLMHGVMRYMANRHPQALLEHAPQGMAKVDGELMRNDPRVKANFGACLQVGPGVEGCWVVKVDAWDKERSTS